ncbi:MAG: hypothetical protein NVS3B20_22610 [Polyangiales bacterium]
MSLTPKAALIDTGRVSASRPSSNAPAAGATNTRGRLLGTPIVGALDWFLQKHGPAAGAATIAELPLRWRALVKPHSRTLGLLGSHSYPYAFVGDLVETMARVVRAPDLDLFIADLSTAGVEASMNTVMRVILRYAASPVMLASRGQEAWDLFHDSGRVSARVEGREYVSEISNWPSHHLVVCKIGMYVRRRMIEKTGAKDVVAVREKCQSWGHDVCIYRLRWT